MFLTGPQVTFSVELDPQVIIPVEMNPQATLSVELDPQVTLPVELDPQVTLPVETLPVDITFDGKYVILSLAKSNCKQRANPSFLASFLNSIASTSIAGITS